MAGGRGERFWPESRATRPKQLLPIVGESPMLAQTVGRLKGVVPVENIFVITNAEQREAVLEVCLGLDPEKVIGEPVGRDTAAAVGLATLLVRRADPEASFAILPADAVIHDGSEFQTALEAAFSVAETEPVLAMIGIIPTYPATGYGYILKGSSMGKYGDRTAYHVERFVEKPDFKTAQNYLNSGGYYWNAGMFIWSVSSIVPELQKSTPELWHSLQSIDTDLDAGLGINDLLAEHYPNLEKISVDYAIIEKAKDVVMLESGFDWDDVGEWSAIARHYPEDPSGNILCGTTELIDASGNIIYCHEQSHLIALLGVNDLIVVKTGDATLICHKDKAQKIKDLVRQIGAKEALKKHLI